MDATVPRWKALLDRSTALSFRGDPEAIDLAHQALDAAEADHGEGSVEAIACLRAVGMAYHARQDWGRTARFLGAAVRAAGAAEDGEQAHAMAQLAYCQAMRGEGREAVELAEKACAMAERTGPPAMHAKTVGNLAVVHHVLRDPARTVEACAQAERLLRAARATVTEPLEIDVDLGVTAWTRGRAALSLGDLAQADEALAASLASLEAQRANGLRPAAAHVDALEAALRDLFAARGTPPVDQRATLARLEPLR